MSETQEPDDDAIKRTEHHKTATKVTTHMFEPQGIHEKQMLTNIPHKLLPNAFLLSLGIDGLNELTQGDVTVFHDSKVTIMRTNDDGDLVPFRTINRKAWTENRFFGEFWGKVNGDLMELLMSVPVKKDEGGWRAEQGERMVGSLVTGERQLMEAANQNKPGFVRRLVNAARGK